MPRVKRRRQQKTDANEKGVEQLGRSTVEAAPFRGNVDGGGRGDVEVWGIGGKKETIIMSSRWADQTRNIHK